MLNKYSHIISAEELDQNGYATIPSLYHIVISKIGINIRKEGLGVDVLASRGQTWALARCSLEILYRPTIYTELEVSIWSGAATCLCADRCFVIKDKNGSEVAHGVTQWCILDKQTRCPIKYDLNNIYIGTTPYTAPKRLSNFQPELSIKQTAGYSECDFNGHLNNSKYIEKFFDILPDKVASNMQQIRLDINFKREIICGKEYSYGIRKTELGYEFCMHYENQTACCATIEIEKMLYKLKIG
ncbi:MAG: hypothetical protein HUK15_05910 [Bacteroidales bacterium]|nr:hypothetical protein [Bacteroidales bacterium]